MPRYDYTCPSNGRTIEVSHSMAHRVKTWGELCELAGEPSGETPDNATVVRELSTGTLIESGRKPADVPPAHTRMRLREAARLRRLNAGRLMYGKSTENAIAAMSRLAEVWDGGVTKLSASDIAENRGLQKPFVSKILSVLAQAGLVSGTRGPGGGFKLARDPSTITLMDVYSVFERENISNVCPFGGGVCGVGDACVLHDKLVEMQERKIDFLKNTSFDDFRVAYQDKGLRPAATLDGAPPPRQSFRARETHSSSE